MAPPAAVIDVTTPEPVAGIKREAEDEGGPELVKKVKEEEPETEMAEPGPKSFLARYCEAVTIYVGQQDARHTTAFTVHIDLLQEKAPGIAIACLLDSPNGKNGFVDGDLYHLRGVQVPVFSIFMVWLYTGELVPPPPSLHGATEQETDARKRDEQRIVRGRLHESSGEEAEEQDEESNKAGKAREPTPVRWVDSHLIDIFLFAQKFGISALSDEAVSELWMQNELLGATTSLEAIKKVYQAVPATQSLCVFLAREAARRLKETSTKSLGDMGEFPAAYVSQILRDVLDNDGIATSREASHSLCVAHLHAPENNQDCLTVVQDKEFDYDYGSSIYAMLRDVGTVFIGRKKFTVHRGLAAAVSEYVRALNVDFVEGEGGQVTLDDEQPSRFALLLHWMYTTILPPANQETLRALDSLDDTPHRIALVERAASSPMPEEDCIRKIYQDDLVQLYIFADRRGVKGLKNQIMDRLVLQRAEGWPLVSSSPARISTIYSNLPKTSGLRLYVEHEASQYWPAGFGRSKELVNLPSEFLAVVLKALLKRAQPATKQPKWYRSVCRYHQHPTDQDRQECKEAQSEWFRGLRQKMRAG